MITSLLLTALLGTRAIVVGDSENLAKTTADSLRSEDVEVLETRVERRTPAPIGIAEAKKLAFQSRADLVVIVIGTGNPTAREYEIAFDAVDVRTEKRVTRGKTEAHGTIGEATDAVAAEIAAGLSGDARAPVQPIPPIPPVPPTPPLDPVNALFSAERVMRHQRELGLNDQQRDAILGDIRESQAKILELQWKTHAAAEDLAKVLDQERVTEKEALEKADELMRLEADVKRAHLSLLVRVKNHLTAEQQKKLRDLRR